MRKRFRTKKRIKLKKLFVILSIIFLFYISNYFVSKIKLTSSNEDFLNIVLSNSEHYSFQKKDNNSFIDKTVKYIKEKIFNTPIYFLNTGLNYKNNKTNSNVESEFLYVENDEPLIYIYNSHQGETYSYEYLEEYNIIPDVLMASKMLKEKLEVLGIKTIVEENDILKYMEINNLDHSGSYIASRFFLEKAINKYPSIKLFIDLHRDAIAHDLSYTIINGKNYAKVLFVIGLENPYYEKNLYTTNQINEKIKLNYPTLTRGIMKKQGYGVNGVYNQDLNNNVILLEMGGYENNIEEINNTLDIIAQILKEYINEKE